MRRLLPAAPDEPLASLYAELAFDLPADRPATFLGMVTGVDGSVQVNGLSGGLGGDADLQAFRALRAAADAVLVGAGTVRAEDYRGVRLPGQVQEARRAAGRDTIPPVVVVTGTADLDPESRLFVDTSRPPWLLVPEEIGARTAQRFAGLAEVVAAGRGKVDLVAGVRALRSRGIERLLCEGGPSLATDLLSAGLVDELFLTIAPVLAGGGRHLVTAGLSAPVGLRLREAVEHDGDLVLRLSVSPT